MSLIEGKLVRTENGIEGRVLAVALDEHTEREDGYEATYACFRALIRNSNGKLQTVCLDGAEVLVERIEVKPAPLKPEPTTPTSQGERR